MISDQFCSQDMGDKIHISCSMKNSIVYTLTIWWSHFILAVPHRITNGDLPWQDSCIRQEEYKRSNNTTTCQHNRQLDEVQLCLLFLNIKMDMEHNKTCHSLTAGLNKSSLFIFIEETVLKTSLLLEIIWKTFRVWGI